MSATITLYSGNMDQFYNKLVEVEVETYGATLEATVQSTCVHDIQIETEDLGPYPSLEYATQHLTKLYQEGKFRCHCLASGQVAYQMQDAIVAVQPADELYTGIIHRNDGTTWTSSPHDDEFQALRTALKTYSTQHPGGWNRPSLIQRPATTPNSSD